jgi:hydrogenase-4 component F
MRLLALVGLPALAGLLTYVLPSARWRTLALLAAAAVHLAIVGTAWYAAPAPALGGWIAADALGLLILTVVSMLFAVVATYTVGYLRIERPRGGRAFVSCLLGFLAATSLVSVSHHLALLWVGMEATTLAVAPLIFHRHDRRSLEAVWKYLVLSSVGIALALFGVFLLATAQPLGAGRPLVLEDLVAHAGDLDAAWLRAAFVFLLVGFGTKMGLAPLHAWKPDTYGEAPGLVGGLMAGALTSCAFLGVARVAQIAVAAGLFSFLQPLLFAFGGLSLVVAAAFIVGQNDAKRLLAYSSVEHMGLLVLGLALGGVGAYGTALHLVNNALAKGVLFLAVGNVVLVTGTSQVGEEAHGMLRRSPVSGMLTLVGLLAVTGSPPFGMFVSEFIIIRAAVTEGHLWAAALIVTFLAVIFIGIARVILQLCFGAPQVDEQARESPWLVVGPCVLAGVVLLLGLYIPVPLHEALGRAAASLGGHSP